MKSLGELGNSFSMVIASLGLVTFFIMRIILEVRMKTSIGVNFKFNFYALGLVAGIGSLGCWTSSQSEERLNH
jgi:hypothetical protein